MSTNTQVLTIKWFGISDCSWWAPRFFTGDKYEYNMIQPQLLEAPFESPNGTEPPKTQDQLISQTCVGYILMIWGWVKTLVPSEPQNSW